MEMQIFWDLCDLAIPIEEVHSRGQMERISMPRKSRQMWQMVRPRKRTDKETDARIESRCGARLRTRRHYCTVRLVVWHSGRRRDGAGDEVEDSAGQTECSMLIITPMKSEA